MASKFRKRFAHTNKGAIEQDQFYKEAGEYKFKVRGRFLRVYTRGMLKSIPLFEISWVHFKTKIKNASDSVLLHTYIIGYYDCFSQSYGLASHIPYVECFNFIHEWRGVQFKVDLERQIFEKLFIAILLTLRVFGQKSAERKSPKEYFFHISFSWRCMTGGFELWSHV